MRNVILISLLFFLLIFSMPIYGKTDDYSYKIESDLLNRYDLASDVRVIIFMKDDVDLSAYSSDYYKFSIIHAVAMSTKLSNLGEIAAQPSVERIIEDKPVFIDRSSSIPLVRADIARTNYGVNGTGISIAVIDTGTYNHSEFQNPNRIEKQKCYLINSTCPSGGTESDNATDDNGHGTHVSGIAAGKEGVAINSTIYSVKVMDAAGGGYESDVVRGIEWAIDNSADVISMSLGTSNSLIYDDCYVSAASLAVDNATSQGVIVIASAGNCGPGGNPGSCAYLGNNTIGSPGCAKSAITVGSVSDALSLSSFSSRGNAAYNISKPDLVATGEQINSTYLAGYATFSGTSQAAPHVSGAVALLMASYFDGHGQMPEPMRVKAIILNSVNTTDMNSAGFEQRNNWYGSGLLDANEAIRISNFTSKDLITSGKEDVYNVNVVDNIRATLVWLGNSSMTNDLDLKIQSPNGTNYTNPSDANDTVEQLFLSGDSGVWKIFVRGESVDGNQEYFLSSNYNLGDEITSCGYINATSRLTGNITASGNCFFVNSSDVTINCNGFNVTSNGLGTAFNITNRNNVYISNCNIIRFFNGIALENTSGTEIYSNNITNSMYGVKISNSDETNFSYNNIFNNTLDGMYNLNNYNINISDNNLYKNKDGISLYNANVSIFENNIYNNLYGVTVHLKSFANITNNSIYNSTLFGIGVLESAPTIETNRIYNNSFGGVANNYSSPVIRNNTIFDNNGAGIYNANYSYSNISLNRIFNQMFGISSSLSNATIEKNDIYENEYGIYLLLSSGSNIFNNVMFDNNFAIFANFSNSNIIYENNIQNNTNYSVYIFSSLINVTNNHICYNYLALFNNSYSVIENNTFCVDGNYPVNGTWYGNVTNLTMNISNPIFFDSNPVNTSCQFSVDDILVFDNSSIYDHNITYADVNVTEGLHNWTVHCNDSGTNYGELFSYFGIKQSNGESCTNSSECISNKCCSGVCKDSCGSSGGGGGSSTSAPKIYNFGAISTDTILNMILSVGDKANFAINGDNYTIVMSSIKSDYVLLSIT